MKIIQRSLVTIFDLITKDSDCISHFVQSIDEDLKTIDALQLEIDENTDLLKEKKQQRSEKNKTLSEQVSFIDYSGNPHLRGTDQYG